MSNIVIGSVAALAKQANVGLAEAFMSADTIILLDCSGSMHANDDDRSSRYERACKELEKLQANLQGRIALIAFNNDAHYCPGGAPIPARGGTNVTGALQFVFVADGCVDRFVLISDGEPNDEASALTEARRFTTRIDCIFVGPEGGPGADFLKRLAAASGGTSQTIKGASLLSERIEVLMLTGAA
jgi:Mg-chelatase subunit ChlD